MAAGLAQDLYDSDRTLGPIAIRDGTGGLRWTDIWEGNPAVWGWQRIGTIPTPVPPRSIVSGKGHLPYLVNPYSVETGWHFTDWQVRDHRPRLYLTHAEMALGDRLVDQLGSYIILEPTAMRKHPNRRPDGLFWERLRLHIKAATGNAPIVQLMHAEAEYLHGTIPATHATFREACGILSGAALLVTTEGGLAHAAAALRVPAVVLWGGNISCRNLGYPEHRNIVGDDPKTPCGRLVACAHCAREWAQLDPARVADYTAEEYRRGLSGSDRTAHR